MKEHRKDPDVIGSSMVLSEVDALESDQILGFISSVAESAHANPDEEILVFGCTGSGKINNSEITVVIFANRNITTAHGKSRRLSFEIRG
jgi:hypothetical protein